MTAIRNAGTGEVIITDAPDSFGDGWEVLPDPPEASEGWRWDADAGAWAPPLLGPRRWSLTRFLTTLLVPLELLAIRSWKPAGEPAPDDLVFLWAREVILTVNEVNLDDPETAAFLSLCIERGLLAEARAARVLTGLPPEV